MNHPLILSIDQGTTNSKASIVDAAGSVIRECARPVPIQYPQAGWVEQNPVDLWETARSAAVEALSGLDPANLAAVAVTNQRESTLIWDRLTGEPLGPCVSWQCHRAGALCNELRAAGHEESVLAKTGLTLDPMFSAGKARWLLDHIRDGYSRGARGEICFGTVDSWLLWNLTGGAVHACDITNAARTQLFNLHTCRWDDDLLDLFGIPQAILPEVRLSGAAYGVTEAASGLPAGIAIAALVGDSHAALFGHAGFQPGAVKATYGTGSSLMMATAEPVRSKNGLSTTIAWGCGVPTYALEGNIYATGAGVQWMQHFLGLQSPGQVEALAVQAGGSQGVYFVPALVGLGAPYWDANARGLLTGLTSGTTAAHAARAAVEAIAYQIHDVFTAMSSDAERPLTVLLADGGAARNDLLMQFQADILDVPVVRSRVSDLSALGAAYLAGLTTGMWASLDEIAALPRPHDRFEPQMNAQQRSELLAGWSEAVSKTMLSAKSSSNL